MPWRTRAAGIETIETSKLSHDELRAHTKDWHEQREARLQLARGGRVAREARNKERDEISEEWWRQDNRTRGQENLCSYLEEVNTRRANAPTRTSPDSPDTSKLFIPLFCNLNSYMTESPYVGRGMFRDFKTPPEWSVDTSSAGTGVGGSSTTGNGGKNSLFGQDCGPPPQRLGRDPRYRLVNDNGNTGFVQQQQQQQHRQADVQHQPQPHQPNEIQPQQQQPQAVMPPPPPPPMAQSQAQSQAQSVNMQTMPSAMPQMNMQVPMQMTPNTTAAVPGITHQQQMMPMSPPTYHQFQPQQYQAHQAHQAQAYHQQQYQQQQPLFQGGPRGHTLNTTTTTTHPHPHQHYLPYEMEMMNRYHRPTTQTPGPAQQPTPIRNQIPIHQQQHYGQMQQQIHHNNTQPPAGTFLHHQMMSNNNNVAGAGQFQFPTTGGVHQQHGQVLPHHPPHHPPQAPAYPHHGGGGYGINPGHGPGAHQGPPGIMGGGMAMGMGGGNWWNNGENHGGMMGRF